MLATGCGSLPGNDFRGALGAMLELFPDLTPFPELPGRGPGCAMIGRASALLVDLPVQLTSQGWELCDHPTFDQRRASSWWRRDLDDLEEIAFGFSGSLKVSICGPLTLAANLGRPRAEAAIADSGARRDLAQSLHLGTAALLKDLRQRLPEAKFVLQIDEPMLPMVLGGLIPTASGYRTISPVDQAEVISILQPFGPGAVLHCCSGADWAQIAGQAGFAAGYLDLCQPFGQAISIFEQILELGLGVVAGLAQTADPDHVEEADAIIARARKFFNEFGSGTSVAGEKVLLAPSCGLGGWKMANAGAQLRNLASAARSLSGEVQSSRIIWLT